MEENKIYTRLGDKGETSLLGGSRVPKYHIRIEAYGTIDELNSFIGVVRDMEIHEDYKKALLRIQENLFVAESILASDNQDLLSSLPSLEDEDILFLENQIDFMNHHLPELRHFILPGGHPTVSAAHVARCVCRRAERIIIAMSEQFPVPALIITYFNRLSDYLFVLSRKLAHEHGVEDIIWKAK
jgi:cob(I)alamin adenosyltransferase